MPKRYQGFGGEELRRELDAIMTVTEPSQSKMTGKGKTTVGEKRYQDHRPREETETLIKNMIEAAGRPMTFREIARGLDRSPSPHLRSHLVTMVSEGKLIEDSDMAPGKRMVRFWYSLP